MRERGQPRVHKLRRRGAERRRRLRIGALIGEVCATPRDGALAQHTVVAATPLVAAVIAGEAMQLAAARDYRRAPDFRAALEARRKALRSAAKRQ